MDVRERDQRIAAMQKEYAHLAAVGAGQEQLQALFKKLPASLDEAGRLLHACAAALLSPAFFAYGMAD
jgi:hypothetical protein